LFISYVENLIIPKLTPGFNKGEIALDIFYSLLSGFSVSYRSASGFQGKSAAGSAVFNCLLHQRPHVFNLERIKIKRLRNNIPAQQHSIAYAFFRIRENIIAIRRWLERLYAVDSHIRETFQKFAAIAMAVGAMPATDFVYGVIHVLVEGEHKFIKLMSQLQNCSLAALGWEVCVQNTGNIAS